MQVFTKNGYSKLILLVGKESNALESLAFPASGLHFIWTGPFVLGGLFHATGGVGVKRATNYETHDEAEPDETDHAQYKHCG